MKIIKRSTIRFYIANYPKAEKQLKVWLNIIKSENFNNFEELRKVFPTADPVVCKEGKIRTVFNICGNHFRLITRISYKAKTVFIREFLPHNEYDKGRWKK